jgi:hypothetical protein
MYQESDWTILKELLPKWRERYLVEKGVNKVTIN